jgi:hypothetical protein
VVQQVCHLIVNTMLVFQTWAFAFHLCNLTSDLCNRLSTSAR